MVDGQKNAAVWRTEEAGRLVEFGDAIPPILYDTAVLRKAKQQELDIRLHLENQDPIMNLYLAKYSDRVKQIQGIGIDPFFCMYWSTEQHAIHKGMLKETGSYMTMDATGGIAKKSKLPNSEKSPYLFLYQCMTVDSSGSIPTFQMISTAQNAVMISYFLLEIVRSGAPVP